MVWGTLRYRERTQTPVTPPPAQIHNPPPAVTTQQEFVNLDVPFISEAPEGIWKNPWVNACEEASIAMVENFYAGRKSVNVQEAKVYMQMLFDAQDRLYGSNVNSDAARTVKIINDYTSFKGTIKDNPTIEDIKEELRQGRPVISLHYGFGLQNKNISFLATGSSYHMMAIRGFDDKNQEFITNDDGDKVDGPNHRYDYNLFMSTIHDYIFATGKANGPARVIFTSQ